MSAVWAIGLMTGTALDGFADAALIKTDGEKIYELGEFILHPYNSSDRAVLADAVQQALAWNFLGDKPKIFSKATDIITKIYAEAVDALLKKANMLPTDIAFIGGHGLTLVHRPPSENAKGATLQILDGEMLRDLTGIKCVADFRSNDIAHGGQGAPLAPIYHAALMQFANIKPPCAILNLGGVANITYWGGGDEIIAFDVGPANGPINELIEQNGLGTYDRDGEIAASGKINDTLIANLIANPWFKQKYPKSLDRYDFSASMVEGMNVNDGAATLCGFVGECVNQAFNLLPKMPKALILAGGGRKNPVLIREIEGRAKVVTIDSDEIGLRGDAIEAECFGYLAVRSARGLPISFPNTTAVGNPLCGGVIFS